VALASKACRGPFLIENFICCLRIILNCHCLGLNLSHVVCATRGCPYQGRVVKFISLALYKLHKLVLIKTVINLSSSELLWCVKNWSLLREFLRGLALRTRRIMLTCGRILHSNWIFRGPRSCVRYLLRASPVIAGSRGVCYRVWTNVIECVDASIISKRQVLCKLVHDHLLVCLLGSQHIWICLRRHLDKLFIVSVNLCELLVCQLVRVWSWRRHYWYIFAGTAVRCLNAGDIYVCWPATASWQIFYVQGCRLAFRSDISYWCGSLLIHDIYWCSLARLKCLLFCNIIWPTLCHSWGYTGCDRSRTRYHFQVLRIVESLHPVSIIFFVTTCLVLSSFKPSTWCCGLLLRLRLAAILCLHRGQWVVLRKILGVWRVLLSWSSRILWAGLNTVATLSRCTWCDILCWTCCCLHVYHKSSWVELLVLLVV